MPLAASDPSTFEDVIKVLGVVLAVAALVVAAVQVRLASRSIRDDHDRRRKQATVDFWSTTLQERQRIRDKLPDDRDREAIAAFLPDPQDRSDPKNKSIFEYLAYLEQLAAGVNLEIYDFETIRRLAGPRLIRLFEAYEPWVMGRRASEFGEATLFKDWEILVGKLVADPLELEDVH